MSYIYSSNVSPIDRFQQITIVADNGSPLTLRRGAAYSLSPTELARARRFIVLTDSTAPANPTPSDPGVSVNTSTLLGFCQWDDASSKWMYGGNAFVTRPNFDGRLFWLGGGVSADPTPAGLNIAAQGDVWIPSEST